MTDQHKQNLSQGRELITAYRKMYAAAKQALYRAINDGNAIDRTYAINQVSYTRNELARIAELVRFEVYA